MGFRRGTSTMKLLHSPVLQRAALAAVGLAVAAVAAWAAWSWYDSRLPGTYSLMDYGAVDYGGGPAPRAPHGHGDHRPVGRSVSVATLRGPSAPRPDFRATLRAEQSTVRLASGKTLDAWTFNGRLPGPELRVRQHDLVEVTLINDDIEDGVSIHWHGVDVPNGDDGVSGVTQDAVPPGERHMYRFYAHQAGTYWYHSHQSSSKGVKRGLYGAIVVEPARERRPRSLDITAVAHTFGSTKVLGANDGVERRAVSAGTPVRVRLINTDSFPRQFAVSGTPFRVVAIDGTDLNEPSPLTAKELNLAAGGRYDVGFTMPRGPVRLELVGDPAAIVFSPDGRGDRPPARFDAEFDPLAYGKPASTPFGANTRFDRRFMFDIDRRLGWVNGGFGFQWSVNGDVFPDMPMFFVRRGDIVKVTITSRTKEDHPMHLHGHHVLVLSRNGVPSTGSPWWADTLNVEKGETYEVAFAATNPGVWMFHCHNLEHAAEGLGAHLGYDRVSTPFKIGGPAGNHPE